MVGICGSVVQRFCNICTTGMAFTLLATSLFVIFLYVFPLGKAHSCLFLNIVEGSPVVRPCVRGTIVTIKPTNARHATIVSIAESEKATQAGA